MGRRGKDGSDDTMTVSKRASVIDIASALAGGAFFTITVFFFLGAAVWAVLSLMDAPFAVIGAGEAAALIGALVIGFAIVRNAIQLAVSEAP